MIRILFLLMFVSIVSRAQSDTVNLNTGVIRLDGPVRNGPTPLIIITRNKKDYVLDSTALKDNLNPNDIKSVNVFKDTSVMQQYGPAAKNGVVVIELLERNHSSAFKKLKKHLTRIKKTPMTADKL